MKLDVVLGVFRYVRAGRVLAVLGAELAERGQLRVAGVLGRKSGRHAFQSRPDHDHLQNLVQRLAPDKNALAGLDFDEAFLFQLGQRLADRRAGNAELLCDLPFIEAQVGPFGIDVHVHDGVAQDLVDMILQREVHSYRFKFGANRHQRKSASLRPVSRSAWMKDTLTAGTARPISWYTIH